MSQDTTKDDLERDLDMLLREISRNKDAFDFLDMLEILDLYRGSVNAYVDAPGPTTPQAFVNAIENAEQTEFENDLEGWQQDIIRHFDSLLVEAVERKNIQPATVATVLDDWVDDLYRIVADFFDLPEDTFED